MHDHLRPPGGAISHNATRGSPARSHRKGRSPLQLEERAFAAWGGAKRVKKDGDGGQWDFEETGKRGGETATGEIRNLGLSSHVLRPRRLYTSSLGETLPSSWRGERPPQWERAGEPRLALCEKDIQQPTHYPHEKRCAFRQLKHSMKPNSIISRFQRTFVVPLFLK